VIDPLGGSWYVESLTNRLEAEATELIGRIDAMGGVLKAIETGFIQHEIHRSAYAHQTAVERGEIGIVGVNRYAMDEKTQPKAFRIDPAVASQQAERLASLKSRRDDAAVTRSLDDLERIARGEENLLQPLRACVRAHATIGEICGRLRRVFGAYHDAGTL
jgi:methylmalonyl-CoA mutase N-terminal domain/subunit